jgi:carbon monoxide dehydrogenase subunit G
MITKSIDITIDRPVEEVFAFLTDAANHPKWDRSSVAMELEQPGPWRTGTTFREVRRTGPGTSAIRSTIAELEPNRRMEIRSLSGAPFQGHWRLAPDGTGTRLQWSGEMQITGFARLFEPLIARSFSKDVEANFARLKRLLEGQETA